MAKAEVVAAIATASGRAAIGVVRLSGTGLHGFIRPLLGRDIPPRRAVLADFLDSRGAALDRGIALFFPAPHSYTGEDVLELQGHGGPAVLELVLRRCLELGARLAEPGEFSRRAFLNNKLDLAQAESVADLIEAGSEAAARAAMRSLKGDFSREIGNLVAELIELRVLVEACIDFPEDDIELLEQRGARQRLRVLRERVGNIQRLGTSGRLLRDGVRVVLIGQPNVGKSSLLNRLAGEEVAIVTDIPGTTRDALHCELTIAGVPIHIVDTAGLREARDLVEGLGIERAWSAVREADIVLVVVDARHGCTPEDERILAQIPGSVRRVVVMNKIDLADLDPARKDGQPVIEVQVSAKTGLGLDLVKDAVLEASGWIPQGENVFLARTRHLDALLTASEHLRLADDSYTQLELFAEELRLGQIALAQITGEFTNEDLLGAIFSRFCIGK
jgi:tRNA modification GTPase